MPTKKASTPKKKAQKLSQKANGQVVKKPVKKVATKKSGVAAKKTKTNATAKKSAVKKTSPKKPTASKATNGKVLVCASGEACFWTNDGQVLEDLFTLRDALDIMSEEVFKHHVTKEKNDFADWVENVLLDYECAAALRKSRKPKTARTAVVRHLRFYNV